MSPANDMPDDYPWLPGSTRSPLADLGELAVRLGSFNTYDRRGEVVWADRFDYGLALWRVDGAGTGNNVLVTSEKANVGSYALKLLAGTTGAMDAAIIRHFQVFTNPRFGVEFSILPLTTFDTLEINIWTMKAARQWNAVLTIDQGAGKVYISNEPGFLIPIATWYPHTVLHDHYSYFKLIGDFDAQKYVRLLYNDVEYDLSAYTLIETAPGETPEYTGVNLVLTGQASPQAILQVGHVIVTANEP